MEPENNHSALSKIKADRGLVEMLYAHGKISSAARQHALEMLYPHKAWGLWVSRLLLAVGTALILSGVVYFFAFNWVKISPMHKLALIEFGLVMCLCGGGVLFA